MAARLAWQMVDGPGFYPDLDADSYFRDPAPSPSVNNSLIPFLLDASPRHVAYKHPRLNPYADDADGTKATYLGSAVHRIALGRGREIAPIRFRDYKSPTARAARDLALANKRIPILEHELERARYMADALRERIDEAVEGRPYQTEVVLVWLEETPFGPVYCRCMVDVWCADLALELDVKTTRGLAIPDWAGRDMASNGYDLQRGFYARGLAAVFPELAGRVVSKTLYVENMPPHEARPFRLTEASRYIAERKIEVAIPRFAKCLAERSWPGYPAGDVLIDTPTYYQNQWTSRELAGEV